MVVLYNNMLQSLYKSQITTIGLVFVAILIMFMILFRSVILATLAIIPNVLAAGLVLGVMGWFGIPLDMMTITIAAITIGIAVDNTIHFLARFRQEFRENGNYAESVSTTLLTTGKAIISTGVILSGGFFVLYFSEFVPNHEFGLLATIIIITAVGGSLILLPVLILYVKPTLRFMSNNSSNGKD